MHKNKLIKIGVVLIILDVVLYGLLHDISKTLLFTSFQNSNFILSYQKMQAEALMCFKSCFFYSFLKNYLIDAIWFISLNLILLDYLQSKVSILICFVFSIITELLQLFIPKLGTFDIFDLLLYLIISLTFFIFKIFDYDNKR